MLGEHFARRWQRAGLLDDDTVGRIVAWETTHRRPVWLWLVAGLGALAIGLGVLAVIGANWETIPAWLKLAVLLVLTALLAAAVFYFWRRELVWPCETAALLLFALVLGGIALISQVYQLQGDNWQALVLWLALCTPFLALVTRTRLVGVLWGIAAATTWFAAGDAVGELWLRIGIVPKGTRPTWESLVFFKLMTWLPACGLIAISALRRLWLPAREQGTLMLQVSLAGLVVATSLSTVLEDDNSGLRGTLAVGLVAAVIAGAALLAGRSVARSRGPLTWLGVSFMAWVVGLLPIDGGLTQELTRAVLFIAYWAALGWLAARNGWRALFGLAFTVIGVRLLILYFEAIGGLTATGLGLIGGGVLCLVLAAIGWRLTRGVPRRPPSEARSGAVA